MSTPRGGVHYLLSDILKAGHVATNVSSAAKRLLNAVDKFKEEVRLSKGGTQKMTTVSAFGAILVISGAKQNDINTQHLRELLNWARGFVDDPSRSPPERSLIEGPKILAFTVAEEVPDEELDGLALEFLNTCPQYIDRVTTYTSFYDPDEQEEEGDTEVEVI